MTCFSQLSGSMTMLTQMVMWSACRDGCHNQMNLSMVPEQLGSPRPHEKHTRTQGQCIDLAAVSLYLYGCVLEIPASFSGA